MGSKIPILFLKTKSTPTDAYEDLFSQQQIHDSRLEPHFVPVLRHTFKDNGMSEVRSVLRDRLVNEQPNAKYGGIIFTSQRAVEAFTVLVEEAQDDFRWPHLQNVPIYSVGPATTRALRAVAQVPPLQVFGEHTGNGETLAPFIMSHYRGWYKDRVVLPPILFLVGEQRRDIIPNRLMDHNLEPDKRIEVHEVEMYGTREMDTFPRDFQDLLREFAGRPTTWVVVFSPAGCETMLKGIGFLDSQGRVREDYQQGQTIFVATIGPTTRDCLKEFGFTPHACAAQPSPRGILEAILLHMAKID